MRIAIVDDEPLVRRGIIAFLKDDEDVVVIGEASSGHEAVELIRREKPDVVFLDVQMPELDGFGVVSSLEPDELPAIVFVTAFDEYALQAFDVHAVDYLLKPFDVVRFRRALQRARERVVQASSAGSSLDPLIRTVAERRRTERILVKDRGAIVVVDVDTIEWIEAADNYVRLHTTRGPYLMRETVRSLEMQLDERRFARVHRSAIVNLRAVRELQPLYGGEYQIVLASGARTTLSRGYREHFRERLAGGGVPAAPIDLH